MLKRKDETDENTPGPFVVISLRALKLYLAEAYETVPDTPTPVWVELKCADILADVEDDE